MKTVILKYNIDTSSIVMVLIFLMYSCGNGNKNEGVHPDKSRLPNQNNIDFTLNLDNINYDPMHNLYQPDKLNFKSTIRKSQDSPIGYYRTMVKFAINSDGLIYLLDRNKNSINVHNTDGSYLYSIGSGGRGPGEFLKLYTFDFDKDGETLYVLDEFDIEIFKLKNNEFIYDNTFKHNLMRVYDLCVLNRNLYISGFGLDKETIDSLKNNSKSFSSIRGFSGPIFKFDLLNGSINGNGSFGYKYESYSGIGPFSGQLSETFLSCNETTQTILGQLKHFPYLFGYDLNGNIKWTSKFENFISTKVKEENKEKEGPSITFYTNKDVFNKFFPFREIDRGKYSLIQIGQLLPQSYFNDSEKLEKKEPVLRTIMINSENGELYLSDRYKLIAAIKDSTVLNIEKLETETEREYNIYDY